MIELFTQFTHAIEGSASVALTAAFAWGILSVLLSPCHLASIPLIIGLVDEQKRSDRKIVFAQSFLFSFGILASIALIGLITALAGRILGDIGRFGGWLAAAIFFSMGLQLLGILPRFWDKPDRKSESGKSWMEALLTGLIFGIALGPCTFAFMAPILAVAFKQSAEAPLFAWTLVLLYGLGHCTVIVLAGMSAGSIRRYLNWNEHSKGAMRLRKICGVLVLLAGLYLVYTSV